MNMFEDLIEELKEENLLEETVTETSKLRQKAVAQPVKSVVAEEVTESKTTEKETTSPNNEADFYRKRAMEEVAFLQIVEHVFAGVEREQLKIIPKPYNDLEVKKVLHNYLHLSPNADRNERSKAEFQLLQETESWHSSLTLRDERMTTAHLRRYCELSRPPLSPPALVALARFYRNSPYSEPVRNKFDLVVTRLFTKENGKSHREMIFTCDELISHLTDLYAEWSSIPLYSTEPDDDEIFRIVQRFEVFVREADNAIGFDDLIKSNFFTRLHAFKRSANENFYAPLVTAASIECNVRIGNRYVDLLELEKQRGNVASLEDKYGFAHDSAISEATGKTYSLIEILKQKKTAPAPVAEKIHNEPEVIEEKVQTPDKKETQEAAESKAHKWVIAATAFVVFIFLVFHFTGSSSPDAEETQQQVSIQKISIESSFLSEHLQEAHIENGTLKGVILPRWNELLDDNKKDILKQMLDTGGQKGYDKVQLVDSSNKTVAIAAPGDIQILR